MRKCVKKIVLVILGCGVLLFGCGKNDLDKLTDIWEIHNIGGDSSFDNYVIEFYEPDEKGSTCGDLNYITNSGSQRRGKYNYHKSSKKIELELYDEFGVPNDWTFYQTFTLDFKDDNCIQLKSQELTLELIIYND